MRPRPSAAEYRASARGEHRRSFRSRLFEQRDSLAHRVVGDAERETGPAHLPKRVRAQRLPATTPQRPVDPAWPTDHREWRRSGAAITGAGVAWKVHRCMCHVNRHDGGRSTGTDAVRREDRLPAGSDCRSARADPQLRRSDESVVDRAARSPQPTMEHLPDLVDWFAATDPVRADLGRWCSLWGLPVGFAAVPG
jgi:hypothetical protein